MMHKNHTRNDLIRMSKDHLLYEFKMLHGAAEMMKHELRFNKIFTKKIITRANMSTIILGDYVHVLWVTETH